MISSTVSNPIYYTKATEDNTTISTPMLSGSGKNILSFDFLDESALPKSRGGGFGDFLIILPYHLRARQTKILR